jgi:hypothetical protein
MRIYVNAKGPSEIETGGMVDLIQAMGGGYWNGIDLSRPQLAPEQGLSGLDTQTPAGVLERVVSTFAPSFRNGGSE